MRDIKFRIYRDRTKEMEYYDWLPTDRGDEKWMQYTGLTDRHGKEIYEGDILYVGDGFKMEVKWASRYAGFNVGYDNLLEGLPIAFSLAKICEVIGNIYENPELL